MFAIQNNYTRLGNWYIKYCILVIFTPQPLLCSRPLPLFRILMPYFPAPPAGTTEMIIFNTFSADLVQTVISNNLDGFINYNNSH